MGHFKMKKFWLLMSALILSLALTACADGGEDAAETEKDPAPTEEEVKKSLVKFYMGLERSINAVDTDLNAFESAEEPDAELKAKASESATAVAGKIKEATVPAELEEQKAEIESALKDYTAAYELKAEELKKDAPSFDAADAAITKADETIGAVFESLGLLKPSLAKSVN